MIILPAIDLINGAAVRLKQGAEKTAKTYSTAPVDVARRWQDAGARIIHVVNLDGAFGRKKMNHQAVQNILSAVAIPIELGGGIRSVEDAGQWFEAGVSRVIFGTIALQQPQVVQEAVERFGSERIVVGIDGRQNKVAIRGWEEQTQTDVLSMSLSMKKIGVVRIIFTDVSRDGELIGPNIESTEALARDSGLKVIASGGFSALEHFERLAAVQNANIEGAIVGTALYEGKLNLEQLITLFEK
jgi:phosphoribosylformimino-5-aminoimidazole carboxamide ribotide isomerase